MDEKIYKKNQHRAKALAILSPIVFWGGIALAIFCFIVAIRNSIGNVIEIIDMLDSKTHTGEQMADNYAMLVAKYGEWVIGTGDNGFTIVFINIKNALFGGFALANAIIGVVILASAIILGKWGFPLWSKSITQGNQDAVNIKLLKTLK